MPQNSLHNVKRYLVLHQPRCQRVPQRVGIDLADLAAFGNCGQPDLKALGIEVRPGLGREQQPVRVRPCGICQREQMPDQELAQAVRDCNLAVRRACLRRVLDDIGFSALPLCAGIGRCEARCSAGRAASDRAVERGGVPVSRLEDGAAGDAGIVGAGCSRFVERPSIRTPLDGCTVPPDCWAET